MDARGGRVGDGPAPDANRGKPRREEEEEGGGADGEGVSECFYRGVYRFLFSVRVAMPFFGKISAKPSARHDVAAGIPLRPALRACPVGLYFSIYIYLQLFNEDAHQTILIF